MDFGTWPSALADHAQLTGSIEAMLRPAAADWVGWKSALSDRIGVGHSVLHVYFGLLGQLAVAACARRALASWWPWLAILMAELVNEALDWISAVARETLGLAVALASLSDLLLTMALPTVLLVLARRYPRLRLGAAPAD